MGFFIILSNQAAQPNSRRHRNLLIRKISVGILGSSSPSGKLPLLPKPKIDSKSAAFIFFKTYNKFFSTAAKNIDQGKGQSIVFSFKEKFSSFPINLLQKFVIQIANYESANSNKIKT